MAAGHLPLLCIGEWWAECMGMEECTLNRLSDAKDVVGYKVEDADEEGWCAPEESRPCYQPCMHSLYIKIL